MHRRRKILALGLVGLASALTGRQAHAATPTQPAMRIAALTASPHVVIRQGVVTFRVSVTGLRLDLRHMGKKALSGHGHLQYYLDRIPADAHTRKDLKQSFIAAVATPVFSFNFRASRVKISAGQHRVIVALARNDDILYKSPTSSVTLTVR